MVVPIEEINLPGLTAEALLTYLQTEAIDWASGCAVAFSTQTVRLNHQSQSSEPVAVKGRSLVRLTHRRLELSCIHLCNHSVLFPLDIMCMKGPSQQQLVDMFDRFMAQI